MKACHNHVFFTHFPGVERCPAGWQIKRQEPDDKGKTCSHIDFLLMCDGERRQLSGGARQPYQPSMTKHRLSDLVTIEMLL